MARAKCKMEMMDTKRMCQPSIKKVEAKNGEDVSSAPGGLTSQQGSLSAGIT